MEFIGDSITCGYGIEGGNATCPFEVKLRDATTDTGEPLKKKNGDPLVITMPVTERQYLSYTAAAARALDADAVTICWSGKGVYKNYKDRFILSDTGEVVPELDNPITVPNLWEQR